MKKFKLLLLTLIVAGVFVGTSNAQRKAKRKSPAKQPAPATKIIPPLEVRTAREKVDIQLSNVNDFEKKLALIAQGLEVANADAKAGRLKPETAAKIAAKKAEIVDAIRNIRVVLGNLESEFRTKPALSKYLTTIDGITDLTALAEDAAIANKFVDSKGLFRDVAKKLTDTLAIMPK
jgi:hypothetical protein